MFADLKGTKIQPDILVITEIFPKNIGSTKILPVELNLDGYYFMEIR